MDPRPKSRGGDVLGRVLLVEDSDPLAIALRRVLQTRPFDVVRAVDGMAACEILQPGAHFDVVLSDVTMPRLDGLGLLRWVRANRSDLVSRCLFMTGEPDGAAARAITRTHVHPVLEKPLEHATLFALIEAILEPR
jgi:DNA-binding response OmpR family regulator